MATITFSICPMELDMCRVINDTIPFRFNIKDEDEQIVNISGFVFKLTVDPSSDPSDASDNLFVLDGNIIDGPNGIVEFSLSTSEANQTSGVYFFDVQMTDAASKIRTIAKGKWTFGPDITK